MLIQLMISSLVVQMHHHKERTTAGRAWIVFGRNKTRNWPGMMNLTTLTLPDCVVIDGAVASGDNFWIFSEWKS